MSGSASSPPCGFAAAPWPPSAAATAPAGVDAAFTFASAGGASARAAEGPNARAKAKSSPRAKIGCRGMDEDLVWDGLKGDRGSIHGAGGPDSCEFETATSAKRQVGPKATDRSPHSARWSRMMISAKNVTPSISAAAMIMAVWMLPAVSGWRAMLSTAERARLPIPNPAPMMTRPTPMARRSENGARVTTGSVPVGAAGWADAVPCASSSRPTARMADLTNFIGPLTPWKRSHNRGEKLRSQRAARQRRDEDPPPRHRPPAPRRSVRVDREADEQRGQEGEDVRLQEGHEQFQQAQQDHAD